MITIKGIAASAANKPTSALSIILRSLVANAATAAENHIR